MKKLVLALMAVACLAASAAEFAYAAPLILHNTGEGLSTGQLDPNWTVELPDGTAFGPAVSAIDVNGAWVAPQPGNTWISVVAAAFAPLGLYRYTTTFTIAAGVDPATAEITGNWWSDDPASANGILLNGALVSDFDGAFWFDTDFANAFFSINTGFVAGLNTLTFLVENIGGPGGVLVQNLAGSVPEPGTLALLGLGLLGLGVIRRRAR